MITIPAPPPAMADACPECPPGIPDASPPIGPVTGSGRFRVTDHQCQECGTAWTATSDRWGFVHDRSIAIAPEQARAA